MKQHFLGVSCFICYISRSLADSLEAASRPPGPPGRRPRAGPARPSRAGLTVPGLTRARLTGSPSRPSNLDRLTGSPSRPSPQRSRAHRRAHGLDPARPSRAAASPGLTRARLTGSPAHGLTGWTGPTFESRGQSRAGLTGGLTARSRPSKHESRAGRPERSRAHESPAHRLTAGRAHRRAHGPGPRTWTGSRAHELDRPDLREPRPVQGRAHRRAHGPGPGPRSTRARLTGSRSARELVQERADPVAGESRPAHESRSKPPKWPFSARYRASSPIQALEPGPAHRRGSRPPTCAAHRLTGSRRAEGHELDRPDFQGPRPVQGRAHRLTVQALQARGHGSRPRPGPPSTRAGPGAPERSRAHGLTAGRRPRAGPAHRLTGSTALRGCCLCRAVRPG